MTYRYTKEWLATVDRRSPEFLVYCEGRAVARLGAMSGSDGLKAYFKEVTDKRGAAAAQTLKQLGHEIYLHEKDGVLKPIPAPEDSQPCVG